MSFFFFNDTATTEIYTLSLHDALPISAGPRERHVRPVAPGPPWRGGDHAGSVQSQGRSEEHTSELQSLRHLVCRLLLEKKKTKAVRRPARSVQKRHAMDGPHVQSRGKP